MPSIEDTLEHRDRLEWEFYQASYRYGAIRDFVERSLGGDITRDPGLVGRVSPSDVEALEALHLSLGSLVASVRALENVNQIVHKTLLSANDSTARTDTKPSL